MNKANLKLVLDRIILDPSCWNQTVYHCGTQHCIAGWGQLMSGRAPNDSTVTRDAREFFDISQREGEWLFAQKRTLEDLKTFLRNGFWNKKGFGLDGYDKDRYDKDGFNPIGLDREGYGKEGYDSTGYDRDGFNRDGYNYRGYDREGFDMYGFDVQRYDRNGFNRDGYNREGYNEAGFDNDGLTRNNKFS